MLRHLFQFLLVLLQQSGIIVTSAPKETPHKRNARCETNGIPLKPTNRNIVPKAKVNIKTVRDPKWLSITLPAKKTDIIVPIPNSIEAILMPPANPKESTSGEIYVYKP